MHAAVVTEFGLPPVYAEFRDPEPIDGEVVGAVRAAAVPNLVRAVAAGMHYSSSVQPPLVIGLDGVVELPDGVLAYVPGVRAPWGTLAERAAVPLAAVSPLPAGLAATQAAAVVNAARASWLPLTRVLEPGATPTVLVLGATGPAGIVAVSVAKHLGAGRVIAVGREGAALRRAAERGADEILPIDDDLESAVARAGAAGVDIVVDLLWGDVAVTVLRSLARSAPHPRYRIDWINSGALDGAVIPLDASLLRMSDLHVWGSGAGAYPPERLREMERETLELAASGVLEIDIQERPLESLGATWNDPGRLVYCP